MRSIITKTIATLVLGGAALGATAATAGALLPAVQAARETSSRLSAGDQRYECWDWTNEDGTTGSECRAI